ncbi:MAG TPA: hypothetical protein VFG22_17750, partial [Polyangiales bacterium]|nr:hypothetical protein [Polyangiales bacterium]
KGVANVYRETFDMSLRIGVDILRELGLRAYQSQRAAQKFRRHDELSLIKLAQLRHDRVQYLSAAREQIEYLEKTMLEDLSAPDDFKDTGWDAESLRKELAPKS